MRILRVLLSSLIVGVLLSTPTMAQERNMCEYYVSVNGNDKNPGTQQAPFKTLKKARDTVRTVNKNMTGDIVVNVASGSYYMEETFVLDERDSGTNGYDVVWKGDNMNSRISGGYVVDNFMHHKEDIYRAVLPEKFEGKVVANMTVNGKIATVAHTRELMKAEKTGSDRNNRTGLITRGDTLFKLTNPEEARIQYNWSWRSNTAPVAGVGKTFTGEAVLLLDNMSIVTQSPAPQVFYTYTIWNDYSLMTEPNDFFYDSKERMIYYKKPAELDIESAVFEVAALDAVMKIQGKNCEDKVQNIVIEGFTFENTDDFSANKYGYNNDQSIILNYNESQPDYPFHAIQTASVWVNNAENITVTKNRFANSQRVGLGLYEGVTNSKIEGNIFENLASAALSIGMPSHRWVKDKEYGMTNVAYAKTATASTNNNKASYGNDEYNDTWLDFSVGDGAYAWWQVDLGESYSVNRVEIDLSSTQIGDFEIWGSNQADFLEYRVILKSDETINPNAGISEWGYDVYDRNVQQYRYIRLVLKENKTGIIKDFRVYTKDLNGMVSSELCSNNVVSNNVVHRVGSYLNTAAAITAFYVADTDVVNNELYGTPYSSISIGWGWDRSLDKTMKNNRVNRNFVVGAMQKGFDGGGIYSLGIQQNEEIAENYVKDMRSPHAGIYPDNGANDILITRNVVENVPEGYFPYSGDQNNLRVEDNYSSTPANRLGAKNSYIRDNKLFVRGYMPNDARKIAEAAGLESEYAYLRDIAGVDRNTTQYADNYPTADELNMYAYSFGSEGIISYYIDEAEMILEIAKGNSLLTEENRQLFENFEEEIEKAKKAVYLDGVKEEDKNLETRTVHSFILTGEFRKKITEFINSGLFKADEYNYIVQNKENFISDDNSGGIGIEEITVDETTVPLYEEEVFDTNEMFDNIGYFKDFNKTAVIGRGKIDFTSFGGCYMKYKFKDVTFKTSITTENPSYPGFVMREQEAGKWSDNAYLIVIKSNKIELQKFVDGKQIYIYEDLPVGDYVMGERNDVEVTTVNESGGVRLKMTIRGKEIFNHLDTDPGVLINPGFFSFLTPSKVTLFERVGEDESIFDDMKGYEWANSVVTELYFDEIINGVGNRLYEPSRPVTRAEFSVLLQNIMELPMVGGIALPQDITEDSWYKKSAETLYSYGAFDDICDALFEPGKAVSRLDAAVIISNILKKQGCFASDYDELSFTDTQGLSATEKEALTIVSGKGVFVGGDEGEFAPHNLINRAEIAIVIKKLIEIK